MSSSFFKSTTDSSAAFNAILCSISNSSAVFLYSSSTIALTSIFPSSRLFTLLASFTSLYIVVNILSTTLLSTSSSSSPFLTASIICSFIFALSAGISIAVPAFIPSTLLSSALQSVITIPSKFQSLYNVLFISSILSQQYLPLILLYAPIIEYGFASFTIISNAFKYISFNVLSSIITSINLLLYS